MIKIKANYSTETFKAAQSALQTLKNRNGRGAEFLGWMDYPSDLKESDFESIDAVVNLWKSKSVDLVVVIGIGGSYLGAKAALEALKSPFSAQVQYLSADASTNLSSKVTNNIPIDVVFAGQNLSADYHCELLRLMATRSCATVVISKSGTTTEPAIAFRLIREFLEKTYGEKEAAERIVAVTDASRGALKTLSNENGYKTFVIPDNVGGRYSVLTPVGLLPIALAGFDIRALVKGALDMRDSAFSSDESNPALVYAAARNECYSRLGKKIELLLTYEPSLQYFSEWWKQLFGESEGKEAKGIFPASAVLTSDLHSMGQYIQDGERSLFETVISVSSPRNELIIPSDKRNLDGLNFLASRSLDYCNKMAQDGTRLAHEDAGVPNLKIEISKIDEYNLGSLFYMMEVACGISAYMLNVNPFDQPGVEAYKKNMFALLEKPGYEELRNELLKKL